MKSIKLLVLFISCIIYVSGDNMERFEKFISNFDKKYVSSEEKKAAYEEYKKNIQFIDEHNKKATKGLESYTLGENEFTDLSFKQFVATRTGLKIPADMSQNKRSFSARVKRQSNPSFVDWRNSSAVTPVKNQGNCGSCWAFSATGSLEGQWFKKTGNLVDFSDQQLTSCSSSYGNSGCNGGWMNNAFNYVMANGIQNTSTYSYISGTTGRTENCTYNSTNVVAKNIGYINVATNEAALETAVATVGPISVAVHADSNFQNYKSGVLTRCGRSSLNHAVLVVGYDKNASTPYWIVKNSWGTNWGDKGYIKIQKGKNICLIANYPSYPVF